MGLSHLAIFRAQGLDVTHACFRREKRRDNAHRAAGVGDINRLTALVIGMNLHRRMHAAGGGPADEQGHVKTLAFHLARHETHLVKRGCDEAGKADHIDLFALRRLQNLGGGNHHPKVDDFVIIAGEHHAHDVLADIVHIALHGRHEDLACGRATRAASGLFSLHIGHEHGHGLFHHPRRFHHLGQEHLARAKEIADHIHARHERAFDDVERPYGGKPRFLHVGVDKFGDAIHQRIFKTLGHGLFAPGQILLLGFDALALELIRDGQQPLGGIRAAVEHHILAGLAQLRRDLLIDLKRARIDDAHVEPGADGVEEEHRMHGLAHGIIAAKREGEIGDAAGHMGMGQTGANGPRRLDEIDAVIVVFLDARGDRENIGIEDDVLGREAHLLGQHLVSARADLDLARERVGLALLIKGHDDNGGPIAAHEARLFDEFRLALLERNGIHHRLALNAFEAGFDHLELRRVDHDGRARNVGLGGDQMQEIDHGALGIQQAFVHVDVDDLRAIDHLLARHIQRCGEFAVLDELAKTRGARDIGALAHIHEANVLRQCERLESREPQHGLDLWRAAGAEALHAIRKGGHMGGRGAAATADDVHESSFSKLAKHVRHIVGALVIEAEFIGQARIGIGQRERICDTRNLRRMLAQFARAEGAVEAHREGLRMAQGMPEGCGRLT